MKSYTTAVKEKAEGSKDTVDFEVDGETFTAHKPNDAQIAILVARTGRRATQVDVTAAALDFFGSVLDKKGAARMEDRLLDREDDFDVENVIEILYDLIEEWTGRPTVRQSASTG